MKKDKNLTILIIPHSGRESIAVKIPIKLIKALSILLFLGVFISSFFVVDYFQLNRENNLLSIAQIEDIDRIDYYSENYLEMFHNLEKFKEKLNQIDELEKDINTKNGFASSDQPLLSEDNSSLALATNHKAQVSVSSLDINQTINDLEVLKRVIEDQEDSLQNLSANLDFKNKEIASLPSIWPTVGRITSPFGYRKDPINGTTSYHEGIDIANSYGMEIYATADGIVTFSGWNGGYGNEVRIDHGNGFVTYYGHNAKNLVKKGDAVKKGQVIASMGSTGRSTGPHVDYRVSLNGKKINPFNYMK